MTVIRKGEKSKNGSMTWWCQCDCGSSEKLLKGTHLRSGSTKSCGCLRKRNGKLNNYDISGEYGIGYTSKGEEFYFDLEDYEKIKDIYWRCDRKGYIESRTNRDKNGKYDTILFHRLVMDVSETDKIIDHVDHNTYDNRKNNLRIVTYSQNSMNMRIRSDNTSGVAGVFWNKRRNKWQARIKYRGKDKHLGSFDTVEDAIKSRRNAEQKYHGQYSYNHSINISK